MLYFLFSGEMGKNANIFFMKVKQIHKLICSDIMGNFGVILSKRKFTVFDILENSFS